MAGGARQTPRQPVLANCEVRGRPPRATLVRSLDVSVSRSARTRESPRQPTRAGCSQPSCSRALDSFPVRFPVVGEGTSQTPALNAIRKVMQFFNAGAQEIHDCRRLDTAGAPAGRLSRCRGPQLGGDVPRVDGERRGGPGDRAAQPGCRPWRRREAHPTSWSRGRHEQLVHDFRPPGPMTASAPETPPHSTPSSPACNGPPSATGTRQRGSRIR